MASSTRTALTAAARVGARPHAGTRSVLKLPADATRAPKAVASRRVRSAPRGKSLPVGAVVLLRRRHRLAILVVVEEGNVAHVGMLAQAITDLGLRARRHQRQKAVLARDEADRARMARRQQTLRLPHGDALLEEHGDAARTKQRGLLARRRAFDPADDGLGGLFCLVVQPLERRRGGGLRALCQLARGGGEPAEGVP